MEKYLQRFVDIVILGNSISAYLFSFGVFLVSVFALHFLHGILFKRLKAVISNGPFKTNDFILGFYEKMVAPLLYFAAFYFAANQLSLNASISKLLKVFMITLLTIQVARLSLIILPPFMEQTFFKKEGASGTSVISKSILGMMKMIVWGLGIVFILDNLGFNISALVAGLGIGGVAIALATQTILADLFNYFAISFDRPFEVGDFIVFDDYMGVIEKVGIKSTRIRSIGGEQIVISNTHLAASKIRNYKRMHERRVLFGFGVVYETPLEKLEKIPALIRKIIQECKNIRFDRAHFKNFGDSSLNFEVVYYVLASDVNTYMDLQQHINLEIMKAFQKEQIEFAYPVQIQYQKFFNKKTSSPN